MEKVIEDDAYRTQAECKSYDRLVKYFTWVPLLKRLCRLQRHEWGERMKVLIIIPAYNEQDNIERVVKHLTENYHEYDYVVINDGQWIKHLRYAIQIITIL